MYALTLQKRLHDERSLFDENNFKTPARDKHISFIDGPFVIIEYVPYGDLLGYLRRSRGATDCYYDDPEIEPTTNLTSQQMLKYAWQISDAMRYIASKKVLGALHWSLTCGKSMDLSVTTSIFKCDP